MRSHSGWSPLVGAFLVGTLTLLSIRALDGRSYHTDSARLARAWQVSPENGAALFRSPLISKRMSRANDSPDPVAFASQSRHSVQPVEQHSIKSTAFQLVSSEQNVSPFIASGYRVATAEPFVPEASVSAEAATEKFSSSFNQHAPLEAVELQTGTQEVANTIEVAAKTPNPFETPFVQSDYSQNDYSGNDSWQNESADVAELFQSPGSKEVASTHNSDFHSDSGDWSIEEIDIEDTEISDGDMNLFSDDEADAASLDFWESDDESIDDESNEGAYIIPASQVSTVRPATEPKRPPAGNEIQQVDSNLQESYPEPAPTIDTEIEPDVEEIASVWPAPQSIIVELQKLEQEPLTAGWSRQMLQLLDFLAQVDSLESHEAAGIFNQFQSQLDQAAEYSARAATRNDLTAGQTDVIARLKRVHYQFQRRLGIWRQVNRLAASGYENKSANQQEPAIVRAAHGRILFEGIDPSWHGYLYLDEAASEINSLNPNPARQRSAARKVLARMTSTSLTADQRTFIKQSVDPEIVSRLKRIASEPPSLSELLTTIEQLESAPNGYVSKQLNDAWQDLIWSDDPDLQELAGEIGTHYRNANFRFSADSALLNRLIPQMPATSEPISENVMGARVSGQSQIYNQLNIQLIPDAQHLHFNLETAGSVHSDTTASTSGFRIQNQGLARFRVFKRLMIGRNGITSDFPVADVTADQQVVGMQSEYDSIPVVGRIARRIARDKISQQAPATQQMVKDRVAQTAEQKMEQQVTEQLGKGSEFLSVNLLQPLRGMDLEPEAVGLATTTDKMMARYRLAGRDQMASNTCRPADLPGALLNMQVHQSAINNLLNRTGLNGNKFTIDELSAHLSEMLGGKPVSVGAEAAEARFEFAPHDPIRVDFDNDQILVSLNLSSLQIGEGKKWRNLQVKSTYIPEVHGTTIVMVQKKPGISLKGHRLKLRDQLAVRTIFGAVFQEQYEVGALPQDMLAKLKSPNLGIAALNLQSGWLGIAFADLAVAPARNPYPSSYSAGPSYSPGQPAQEFHQQADRNRTSATSNHRLPTTGVYQSQR